MANNATGFVNQYKAELRELTFNSKAIINTLTMLAEENKYAASGIAEAIEDHIKNCQPGSKLPALYLLDSIIKNIGLPYSALFARDIPEVFMAVWHVNPAMRPSLQKLLNTWQRYFPSDKLGAITQMMAVPQVAVVPGQGYQGATAAHVHQQANFNASGQPSISYPAYVDTRSASWRQPMQAYHQQVSPHHSLQQPGSQYAQPAQAQHYTQQSFQNSAVPQNNYASAYTPTYPQPQYVSGQPLSPHLSPQVAQQSPGQLASGVQGAPQNALPAFLSELIGAGILPAVIPGGAALNAKPVAPRVFDASKFKELSAIALQQLYAGTEKMRPTFLDQRLHKKRKLAAGVAASRQWFVKQKDWLAGTSADAEATPAFFDEPEQAEEEKASEEEVSVPADPAQPSCAISQETFETFWDDATNEWRYLGAVALNAEQAELHSLSEGQLVKVSCLAPPNSSIGISDAVGSLQAAKQQQAAEEIAKTTLSVTEGAGNKVDEKPGANHVMNNIPAADLGRSPKRQKTEAADKS